MTTISKVRNEIRFIREDGKYWAINIDNGNIIGYKGGVIQRMPKNGKDDIQTYIATAQDTTAKLLIMRMRNYDAAKMQFAEKMWNANNNHFDAFGYWSGFNSIAQQDIAKLVRYATQNLEGENASRYNFEQLYQRYEMAEKLKPFKKLIEQYGEEAIIEAVRYIGSRYEENYNNAVTMWLYYHNDEALTQFVNDGWIERNDVDYKICELLDMCYEMGVKPNKSSVLREYGTVLRNYTVWRDTARNEVFKRTQNPAFTFEDDNFIAIVPTTMQELVDEGTAMRNCAGGYWVDHYGNDPERGFNRGIVFVRRKDNPQRSYITCDFSLGSMRIQQYLGECNNGVRDAAAREFRDKLQQHLLTFVQQ